MNNLDYNIIIDQVLPPIIKKSVAIDFKFNYNCQFYPTSGVLIFYNINNSKEVLRINLSQENINENIIKLVDTITSEDAEKLEYGIYYKVQLIFSIVGKNYYSNYGISKCLDHDSYKFILTEEENKWYAKYYTTDEENYLNFYSYDIIDNETQQIIKSYPNLVIEENMRDVVENLMSKEFYDEVKTIQPISFKSQNLKSSVIKFKSNNDLDINKGNIITRIFESNNKKYYVYTNGLYENIDNNILSKYWLQPSEKYFIKEMDKNQLKNIDKDQEYFLISKNEDDLTENQINLLKILNYDNILNHIANIQDEPHDGSSITDLKSYYGEINYFDKNYCDINDINKNYYEIKGLTESGNYIFICTSHTSSVLEGFLGQQLKDYYINSEIRIQEIKNHPLYDYSVFDDAPVIITPADDSGSGSTFDDDTLVTITPTDDSEGSSTFDDDAPVIVTPAGDNQTKIEISNYLKKLEKIIANTKNILENFTYVSLAEYIPLNMEYTTLENLNNASSITIYQYINNNYKAYTKEEFIHSFYEKYEKAAYYGEPEINYYQLTADDEFFQHKKFELNTNKQFNELFKELNKQNIYMSSDLYPPAINSEKWWLQHYYINNYICIYIPLSKLSLNLNKNKYIITYINSKYGEDKPRGFLFKHDNQCNLNSLNVQFLKYEKEKTCSFILEDNEHNYYNENDYLCLCFLKIGTNKEIQDILANLQIFAESDIGLMPPYYSTKIPLEIPSLKYSNDYSIKVNAYSNLKQNIELQADIKKTNVYQKIWFPLLIKTQNLPNEGCINIGFESMDFEGAAADSVLGNFQLVRADKNHNFDNWEVVTKFTMSTGLFNIPSLFKDYSVEQGVEYLYGVQQINEYGVVSDTIKSYDTTVAQFDDMFLIDAKAKIKIKFNPKVTSFKTTKQEQKTETLGSKYPYIMRNYRLGYKEIPISGLISYNMDDSDIDKFIELTQDNKELEKNKNMIRQQTWDNYINNIDKNIQNKINYTTTDLTYDNFYRERQFKLSLLDWLNNNEYKLLKTPTEGNYIVQLTNVSLTPNDTVGRMLHTFQATAYEVADYNFNNLNNYIKLNQNINNDNYYYKIETQSLKLNIEAIESTLTEEEAQLKFSLNQVNNLFNSINVELNNLNAIGFISSDDQEDIFKISNEWVKQHFRSYFNTAKEFYNYIQASINILNQSWKGLKIRILVPKQFSQIHFFGLPEQTKVIVDYKKSQIETIDDLLKTISNNIDNNTLFKFKSLFKFLLDKQIVNTTKTEFIIGKTGVLNIENALDIVSFTIDFSNSESGEKDYNILNQAGFTYSYKDTITSIQSPYSFNRLSKCENSYQLSTFSGRKDWDVFDPNSNSFVHEGIISKNVLQLMKHQGLKQYGSDGVIYFAKNKYVKRINNNIHKIEKIDFPTYYNSFYNFPPCQIRISKKQFVGEITLHTNNITNNIITQFQNKKCEKSNNTVQVQNNLNLYIEGYDLSHYGQSEYIYKYKENDKIYGFYIFGNYFRFFELNSQSCPYINSFYIGTEDVNYNNNLPFYYNHLCECPSNQIITLSNLDNIDFFWLGTMLQADVSYLKYLTS